MDADSTATTPAAVAAPAEAAAASAEAAAAAPPSAAAAAAAVVCPCDAFDAMLAMKRATKAGDALRAAGSCAAALAQYDVAVGILRAMLAHHGGTEPPALSGEEGERAETAAVEGVARAAFAAEGGGSSSGGGGGGVLDDDESDGGVLSADVLAVGGWALLARAWAALRDANDAAAALAATEEAARCMPRAADNPVLLALHACALFTVGRLPAAARSLRAAAAAGGPGIARCLAVRGMAAFAAGVGEPGVAAALAAVERERADDDSDDDAGGGGGGGYGDDDELNVAAAGSPDGMAALEFAHGAWRSRLAAWYGAPPPYDDYVASV